MDSHTVVLFKKKLLLTITSHTVHRLMQLVCHVTEDGENDQTSKDTGQRVEYRYQNCITEKKNYDWPVFNYDLNKIYLNTFIIGL